MARIDRRQAVERGDGSRATGTDRCVHSKVARRLAIGPGSKPVLEALVRLVHGAFHPGDMARWATSLTRFANSPSGSDPAGVDGASGWLSTAWR